MTIVTRQHRLANVADVHVVHSFEVSDITARDALLLSSADVGRVVRVLDSGGFYLLRSISPIEWVALDSRTQRHQHIQGSASSVWSVQHNLGRYPAIVVFDSAGDEVLGDVRHNSTSLATITFSAPFAGTATCS